MRLAQRLLVGGVLFISPLARAQDDPAGHVKDAAGNKPTIELVFVIDTTGSMGGLIEGAKQKVWSIVNDVMKAPSRPEVRMGLVAYRDRGDAYVTQITPVTRDLDRVYNTLMAFRAEGGGDGPENVRRALADGVHKAGWSPRSANLAQILFLVGDAPPHDDYADEPDTVASASEAVKAGILVNTIQCGHMDETAIAWQKISRAGEGRFFGIAQDGGVAVITTPYDEELSRLAAQSGQTYMAYGGRMMGGMGGASSFRAGKQAAQSHLESKLAASAPVAAQADRSVNKAINAAAYDEFDLIQAVEGGKVKLESVDPQDLPDQLQKLSGEERKKAVEKKIEERKAIRERILELSKKRDAFLKEERQKQAAHKPAGFDEAVSAALKEQIARRSSKP